MSNKELLDLYKVEKNGLISGTTKKCLCGKEVNLKDNICPTCGSSLQKSKLLNVAKNTALSKRDEYFETDDTIGFRQKQLLSAGFELYEQTALEVIVNLKTEEVKISNIAMFKKQTEGKGVFEFFNKYLPGFIDMAQDCIDSANNIFSKFTSLTESNISNILHVYLNYKAIYPYLLKYKILYFGNLIDFKKYYPDVDFNKKEEVNALDINLQFLKFWDIKNTKYLESIINISKEAKNKQEIDEMLEECTKEANELIRNYWFDGNQIIDTFSLLYNREIDIDNFIRIFKKSKPENFFQLKKYRVQYKRLYRKDINWEELDGISRKDLETLDLKTKLKANKIKNSDIEAIYNILNTNPIEALKRLQSL